MTLQQRNAGQPGTLTGTDRRHGDAAAAARQGRDVVDVEMLNLVCADGMRSVPLSDVQRVRFLNPVLDAEFQRALEVLAGGARHAEEGGQPELQRRRQARRAASATSSRARSGRRATAWCSTPTARPYLQGWAVVENTTDEDWNGRPDGAGRAAGRSRSRWTCTSRCTSRGRRSSRSCSRRCGRRPMAGR